MKAIRAISILAATVLALGAPIASGGPVALADCAADATFCVQLDRASGTVGQTIGVTAVTRCADASTLVMAFVGDPGWTAPLVADPSAGEGRYTFVVPDMPTGHRRVLASCQGLEAWEIAGGFTVTGAPDTATTNPVAVTVPGGGNSVVLVALGASTASAVAWYLGRRAGRRA